MEVFISFAFPIITVSFLFQFHSFSLCLPLSLKHRIFASKQKKKTIAIIIKRKKVSKRRDNYLHRSNDPGPHC
ncbi:hypothetical protein EDB82DRAFT_508497 [Fusarium venenatum]|uniref:uncharacterized protein n=1 Tax=Fusarium venenatum TaxID=56646 RepID=UPI001D6D20C7|nr:hypothetical protein EDB82DRAFT_508497 [Fusarium venenatum]